MTFFKARKGNLDSLDIVQLGQEYVTHIEEIMRDAAERKQVLLCKTFLKEQLIGTS